MINSSFEQYMNSYGFLTYPIRGNSMVPLLRQNRDLVTIMRTYNGYRPGDIVLYRKTSHYVLHRIIKATKDGYVIMGDNCISKEYGITEAQILGRMTGFIRNGDTYNVDDTGFRIYTWVILHTIPFRIALKKIRYFLKLRTPILPK